MEPAVFSKIPQAPGCGIMLLDTRARSFEHRNRAQCIMACAGRLPLPSFAVVASKEVPTKGLQRALQVVGGNVVVAPDAEQALGSLDEDPLGVFASLDCYESTLAAIGRKPWKLFVLQDKPNEEALQAAVSNPRVAGLLAWGQDGGRGWELRYIARRLMAPKVPPPDMGALFGWGATTVVFQPRTTRDQRELVDKVSDLAVQLGVNRRQARALSTATHELTMNAMYDAPVDAAGKPKYALERTANIELEPREVPTFRFTLSSDFVALDIVDPFGRLPRKRYFEGVLRGHRNLKYGEQELDTSHGGAGLGLHTLYMQGSILRAELQPTKLTHVSWILDRNAPRRGFNQMPRSLYFLPYLPQRAR